MWGSTLATCKKATINYTDFLGNYQTIDYDITKPWSYYVTLLGPGSTLISISAISCYGSGMCTRCRSYCKDEQNVIHWEDGPSIMTGECLTPPEGQTPCNIVNCTN